MNKTLKLAIESAQKTGHSLFSPSRAPTYMRCTGSVYMQREYEDEGNEAADLGTDKHELSEICLRTGTDPDAYLGRIMGKGFDVDEEFVEHVAYYVNFVRTLTNGADFVEYEMECDTSQLTGVPGERGSADCVILKDRTLYVVDAKFGWIEVEATENEQLLMYVGGVVEELSCIISTDDIDKIVPIIVQPKRDMIDDSYVITWDEYEEFKSRLREAIEEACEPFKTGKPILTPGPKQCRFCKALPDCDAAADVVFETVTGKVKASLDDFDNLDEAKDAVIKGTKRVVSLNMRRLSEKYEMIDLVTEWCKAVSQKLHERLEHGEASHMWKLVAGRKGNRKFSDPDEAESILKKARLRQDIIYDRSLKSPTKLAKELKPHPKIWARLEELVVQPDGKPTIAPLSSKKAALKSTLDEFDNLDD